jgi:hypothetical protein
MSILINTFYFSLLNKLVLRLTKSVKSNKTALYITDLYLLEILDSLAYSLYL